MASVSQGEPAMGLGRVPVGAALGLWLEGRAALARAAQMNSATSRRKRSSTREIMFSLALERGVPGRALDITESRRGPYEERFEELDRGKLEPGSSQSSDIAR